MFTEHFLNTLCKCSISDCDGIPAIFSDIQDILFFYEKDNKGIPDEQRIKFDLCKSALKLRLNGHTGSNCLDNIITSKKFESIENFLDSISLNPLKEDEIPGIIKHVKSIKKLTASLSNFYQMREFVDNFAYNNFDSVDDALEEYERLLTSAYSTYSFEKRSEDVVSLKSLNLLDDEYDSVLEIIGNNYSGKSSISTGYKKIDEVINYGFEPGRTYIFAGSSGSGKSTLMLNFIRNIISKPKKKETELNELYAYITLENYIDESLLRLYCSCNAKTSREILNHYESGERDNIRPFFKDLCQKNGTNLDMQYFVPQTVSAIDILMYLEDLKKKHEGRSVLKCVFIDYFDLLKPSMSSDMYRLELGRIAIDLKVLAATLKIPVVTITQLNRSAYDRKEKDKLSLSMMGESIKKVEHSDFVALLDHNQDYDDDSFKEKDHGTLSIFIGKNRSGSKNKLLKMRTNYSKFYIEEGTTDAVPIDTIEISSDAIL